MIGVHPFWFLFLEWSIVGEVWLGLNRIRIRSSKLKIGCYLTDGFARKGVDGDGMNFVSADRWRFFNEMIRNRYQST